MSVIWNGRQATGQPEQPVTLGIGGGQFDVPTSIALGGVDSARVVDWQNNRLQKFRFLPPLPPEATPTA